MDAILTNVFLCVFKFFVIWFRRDQISSSSFLSGMFEHIYPSERSVYIKHDEYGLERGARDHIGLHSLLQYFFYYFYFYSLQIQYTFCYFLDKAIYSPNVLDISANEGCPNVSYEYGMGLAPITSLWLCQNHCKHGKWKVASFFDQLVGSIFQRLASGAD